VALGVAPFVQVGHASAFAGKACLQDGQIISKA
jgi:hypothetical protein